MGSFFFLSPLFYLYVFIQSVSMNNPELQSPTAVSYQTQSDEDVQNPGPQEEEGQKLLVYDVISPTNKTCVFVDFLWVYCPLHLFRTFSSSLI